MIVIRDLDSNKAKQLEMVVLKNWKDNCQFLYDNSYGTCDVHIGKDVPIIIKHYGGGDTQATFFICGDGIISVERNNYGYIIIE